MEISEHTLIELVKGQATVAQAVTDLKDSFDKAIPSLTLADKVNAKAIRSVEQKQWYLGGAGTILGFMASHFFERFLNQGGK